MKYLPIVITNSIKLAGLIVGLFAPHGGFSTHPQAVILAFAGFLMAGAQVGEQTIFGIIERFFGLPGSSMKQQQRRKRRSKR